MSDKFLNKENNLRNAIRKNMEKVFQERKKIMSENPLQSTFSKELAQPAFKFHLNQYNPNLPLGDGTRNVMNMRGNDFIKQKNMDDLESVTTRQNGSVITGHGLDVNVNSLETIKENSRYKLTHENLSKIKSNNKSKRSMILPIHRHEKDILREIENNQTLVIQGSTGCGKSTQVPQFILDNAFVNDEPVNIVVTQPRRIAAISVAMHVASERGWEIGSYVGYQVGLDRKCSNETVISFVTTGVLLEQLIHNQTLTDYTHIILDEVHERDVDMDLLLSVVKDLLMHDTRTKIILMSATVAANKFSCYFSKQIDPKTLEPLPGSIFCIEGKMFPVEEFFLDDLSKLGICQDAPYSYDVCQQPRLTAELKEMIYQLLMYITYTEMSETKCTNINQLEMGSVLVFLPGLSDITELNEYLLLGYKRENCVNPRKRDFFSNNGQSAAIFPLKIDPKSCIRRVLEDEKLQKVYQDTFYLLALHSSIGISEQKRAFESIQLGRRKIILSTNIAESSITVKDIKYVIDLCMIKRLRYDRETHFSSLKAEWASKSSCKQRAGRAGRVRNGVVFRLISQYVYNQLDEFCPPEILTGPLTQVILRIKEFNRDPRALLQRALDCPSLEDIGYTFLTLKEAGALSIKRNEITNVITKENGEKVQLTQVVMPIDDHWQGELTFIGRLISSLPMDLHMGKLIALGYAFDVLEETIIIASCLTVSRSIFSQPFFSGKVKNSKYSKAPNQMKTLDAFEKKLRLSESKYSDLLTMLNGFKLWYQRLKTGAFRSREDEYKWCSSLYLDPQALHEVEVLTDEIKRRLKEKFNITVDFSTLDKKDCEEDAFFEPSANHISNIHSVVISKTFRVMLLQITIAGAFYPNYFLRIHNPFIEDDAMRTFDGLDPFQCVEIGNLPMDEGCLYRDTIADHFKTFCMKFSQDKPVVICRNTKGIIKFPQNNSSYTHESMDLMSSNAFNLSVLLSIKMGQFSALKPRIEVFELTNDEKTKLKAILEKESIKNNQILPLNYKYKSGHKNFIGFPSIECNFIKVYVTYASECGSFYGIYEEEKDNEQKLFMEISEFVTHAKNLVKSKIFEVHDFCLAPYEGDFYRAEIISKSNQNCTVFFVDYGNSITLQYNQLFDLPDFLLKLCPLLAVKFILSEIKPYTAYHPDHKWSAQDKEIFLNYINCYTNTPIGCKIYSVVDNAVRVRVQMVDHQDKILNEELMVMGIAEYAEESYASRQDNILRTKCNNRRHIDLFGHTHSESKINFMKNLLSNDSGSDKNSDSGRESCSQNEGLDYLMKSVSLRQTVPQTVVLSAPCHPYIMKFHGITESCKRPVTLATDSVNSIIIDPEPQNHLHRLLVAHCVQSSGGGEQGNDLLLRNTTLMPSIPGFPFLIALIFTPYAELISDKFQTRYIGAKCGLGIDSEGRPLHPANDMDMITDVRFDSSDIKNVNGIRSLLNIALGSSMHSQDAMDKYQSGIKKFIASLLLKHSRDLVNNNNVGEYRVKTDISVIESDSYSNVRQINKIFIPHIVIEGVARRLDWVRNPILGDPRTERAKAEWLPRYMAAAEENLKDLLQPQRPMSRVKLSRDVLPEVKICELCTQNSDYITERSRLGVPIFTESDLEDHIQSNQHKQNVLQMRNILNV